MKKVRMLIIAVTVALMVMGVGYAAWSQTLTIGMGGTIGIFKVRIDDAYVVDGRGNKIKDSKYAGAEVKDNGREAQLIAKKLTPGDCRDYKVIFKNAGDCTAVLSKIDFKNTTDGGGHQDQRVSNVAPSPASGIRVRVDGGEWIDMSDPHGITLSKVMKPGERAAIVIRIRLEGDAELSEKEKPFQLTATPTFTQP